MVEYHELVLSGVEKRIPNEIYRVIKRSESSGNSVVVEVTNKNLIKEFFRKLRLEMKSLSGQEEVKRKIRLEGLI